MNNIDKIALYPFGEVVNVEVSELKIHSVDKCEGTFCCIHNPSDHHMKDWPMTIRLDRVGALAERRCIHGVGHPDPDSLAYIDTLIGEENSEGVHGCDGCCKSDECDNSTDPTFDADGYPTDATLERIRSWPIADPVDFAAVMGFAGAAWSYPEYWEYDPAFIEKGDIHPQRRYVFSTGGWSGNESIVSAIEANRMVQSVGAWSWRRGGHYEYRFPIEPRPKELERE